MLNYSGAMSKTNMGEESRTGSFAPFEMPSMETIDASWEKISLVLEQRRSHEQATHLRTSGTALHLLDTEAMISLYWDAVASGVSEDFLQLVEEILLERELNGRTA